MNPLVTLERLIKTTGPRYNPSRIRWGRLTPEQIVDMPVLRELRKL